jgi:hypothetical protein
VYENVRGVKFEEILRHDTNIVVSLLVTILSFEST